MRVGSRPFVAALCIVITILVSACGGPGIPITGTITDAYTGAPIRAANISLGRAQSSTNDAGQYQLTSWNPQQTLEVNAAGYETLRVPLAAHPQFAQPQAPSVVLDQRLRPNTLSGTISDTYTGAPLSGVVVRASETISATTDASGRYILAGVPEQFTIDVSSSNYAAHRAQITRQTNMDLGLRPTTLAGRVVDSYSGNPLAGAVVAAGDVTATTDADGRYVLSNLPETFTIEIGAVGYASLTQPINRQTLLDTALRPDVLRGTLIDSAKGSPIRNATIIATPGAAGNAVATARIDNSANGEFALEGIPEHGFVHVLAPGYRRATLELRPGMTTERIILEPFEVRAVYITSAVGAYGIDAVKPYFDLIDRTELNALVIDLKSDLRDDLGLIYYESEVPMIRELGTSANYIDIRAILAEAKRRNIYTIARIQLFSHDNALADARPDWAVKDRATGEVYTERPGPDIRYAWLDPWNRNVWDYNIQLAVEAANLGFDEINFDYIRYPDWYEDISTYSTRLEFDQPTDPVAQPDAMFDNLAEFTKQAQQAINGAGAFLSIDVFGRVVLGPSLPIAQDIARMAPYADYICPMPYPSLWFPGYLGFDNPTAHPYEVVLGSLQSSEPFFEDKRALLRPWLQDHTDPWQGDRVVEYGAAEVRAQIQATEDYGKAAGWMLYDSANTYTEEALRKE
jgi:hypothetical protein